MDTINKEIMIVLNWLQNENNKPEKDFIQYWNESKEEVYNKLEKAIKTKTTEEKLTLLSEADEIVSYVYCAMEGESPLSDAIYMCEEEIEEYK